MRRVAVIATGMLAVASLASAEEAATSRNGSGTTLSMQLGVTAGTMDMPGAAMGATVVQDLGSRVALEGSASYVGQGMGANSFTASASLLFNLLRTRGDRAVPYLSLGGGLYRSAFDMGDGRYYGTYPMEASGRGGMMGGYMAGPRAPSGPLPTSEYMYGHMPQFYRSRLPTMMDPARDMGGHRSFTDPAVSVGGGVRIGIGKSWFVRPDARALVVLSNGDSYTVGVLSFNMGWRF